MDMREEQHLPGWQRKCYYADRSMSSTPSPLYRTAETVINGSMQERRRRTRVLVRWPLLFRDVPGAAVDTVTENLSSEGFYCLTSKPFVPGDLRTCTLSAPAYRPDDGSWVILVECQVRVVRVQALSESGMYGMGCRIEDYRVHVPADAAAHQIYPTADHNKSRSWFF